MEATTANLELRTRPVGAWSTNAYALVCPSTGQSALVDPGADPATLVEMLAGSEPAAILITHTHPDHVGALEAMRARLGVPVMAHPGLHCAGMDPAAARWLHHGDTVHVGEHTVRVYHTPGHTDDQVCYALWDQRGGGDRRVIVGDAIFKGGPGKTWSPQGFRTTLRVLEEIVLSWPDDAICYPGHGPSFRLGDIRPHVEAFLHRDHGGFFGEATWDT